MLIMGINLDSVRNFLFTPLAFFWEKIYQIRRGFYNYGIIGRQNFDVPVVSVGNLTFGGTGKTPFTIWISQFLSESQKRPLVLMRGYKGAFEHGVGVIAGGDSFRFNPSDYGDEALLIARRLKKGAVIVGKNRTKNLEMYFDEIRPDVVLLDDGYQHLKFFRNLNIVLFDATMPLSRYQVAPKGYMREGLKALVDAHAVVISRSDQVHESKIDSLKKFLIPYLKTNTPFAQIRYTPIGVYDGNYKKIYEVSELKGQKVLAVAGLASPHAFFNLLESLGADIVKRKVYPDHYYFNAKDINEILLEASAQGALVVTSEKDMVKIRRISTDVRIVYLEVVVEFMDGENELKDLIKKVMR